MDTYSSSSSQSSPQSAKAVAKSAPLLSRIEEKVAHIYYKYGLMCSRHSYLVILITLTIVGICCYPLIGIRYLLGNSSQQFVTTVNQLNKDNNLSHINEKNGDNVQIPRWYANDMSHAYVQQIIIKSTVIPWKNELILMDAIRAPLSQSFKLMESINNYQTSVGDDSVSLNNICFQVSEPISKIDRTSASYLPTYSCLTLSPTNIWQNDVNKFLQDPTIIKTMYSIKDFVSPHTSGSLREILFGVPWMETGIKRLYVRTIQRTITYAITLVFSKYNQKYIEGLRNYLSERHPTVSFDTNSTDALKDDVYSTESETVTHIYFQNKFTLSDFMPLGATYMMLFLYVYFSVRKIDLVKNKWALALCSVLTVIMSLLMSLGICLTCGFNPTLNGNQILPYLVVIIGLENILVMTKSVVSTPAHLDIKVRVAQGLSREGWSITKNLMTEITLLTFGFFTFVPTIQNFCIFATVGLLSDFFLQISFFATVLSIDIQRIELNNVKKTNTKSHSRTNSETSSLLSYTRRSYPQNVFARPAKPIQFKMPKRLRVIYFVARTRLVQRALMMVLFLWICLFLYKFGIVERFSLDDMRDDNIYDFSIASQVDKEVHSNKDDQQLFKSREINDNRTDEVLNKLSKSTSPYYLAHHNFNVWKLLSCQHWTALFSYYNISLSGKYISILTPMFLSIAVDPDSAISTRNPSESDPQIFRQFLSPSSSHSNTDANDDKDYYYAANIDSFNVPWSKGEIFITLSLSIPSIIFIIYVFVLMYRCICTRNYAEWRASWSQSFLFGMAKQNKNVTTYDYLNLETNPIKLQNQEQELSLLATNSDTPFVVSSCLNGDIRVWDVLSGECHSWIRRSSNELLDTCVTHKKVFHRHKTSGSFSSDSTYGSSPGNTLNDFPLEINSADAQANSKSALQRQQSSNGGGYDFSSSYDNYASSRTVLSNLIMNAAVNSENSVSHELCANINIDSTLPYQTIWCIEIFGKLITVGCCDGRIEVWDAINGSLCYYYEENKSGVTGLKATSTKLIVSRLNGTLEIFHIELVNGFSINVSSSSSASSLPSYPAKSQIIRYNLIHSLRAHLQPITCLQVESCNIITGSLDHVLKVYRSDTANCVYTLHGHCGGITAIHIDQTCRSSAISGCQVGQMCVWDILTGTCVFSIEAHQDASVSSLLATPLYYISSGTDNRVCIWDKYSGHLVHSINDHHSICRDLVLLTPSILITVREDHLVLWDVSEAAPVRMIEMDNTCDKQIYIKCLKLSSQSSAVVCDYGKQLCIIHFPGVTEKID